jgi:hypothetical protein
MIHLIYCNLFIYLYYDTLNNLFDLAICRDGCDETISIAVRYGISVIYISYENID